MKNRIHLHGKAANDFVAQAIAATEPPLASAAGSAIDTGDTVKHAQTGQRWIVACVEGDKLSWVGWPEGWANLKDCTLLKKATEAERDELLRELADMRPDHGRGDHRQRYAARRLSMPNNS